MDVAKIESSPLTVLYVIHDGKASPLAKVAVIVTESGPRTFITPVIVLSTRAFTGLVKNSFFHVQEERRRRVALTLV